MSAGELAQAIASRTLSSREAVEAHIERIEAVNAALNAVVVPLYEQARREAERADAALRRGERVGPLHGVPFTVKESFDVAETPTTMGLTTRARHRAASDAPTVARLRAAGAILLGKTNAPQLLLFNETDNPLYGRTNNPWDLRRAPGGSSGGCAATVAAGGAAFSLGSDIGGSLRFPAHACGVSSLKPTAGRLTMLGHASIFSGQEAVPAQPGPLARRVADLYLAMRILAAPGQETLDARIPPVAFDADRPVTFDASPPVAFDASPPVAFDAERHAGLDAAPRLALEGLRVAFFTDNGIFRPSPAVRRAVEEAARALEERGAAVEEWKPPRVSDAWEMYQKLLFADRMEWARRALKGSKRDWRIRVIVQSLALPSALQRLGAWELALVGQKHLAEATRRIGSLSVGGYWRLLERRADYRANFNAALDARRFDAIICPPDALPALKHGTSLLLTEALSYSSIFNLLGMPAGVVAATRVRAGEESERAARLDVVERAARKVETGSAGLPVGVQVVARHWREDLALVIMAALEGHFSAQPDYPLRPPLSQFRGENP